MNVTKIFADAVREAREQASLVLLCLEIGVQNGSVSTVRERIDDDVPAAFVSPSTASIDEQKACEEIRGLLDLASRVKFFGTLTVQMAVYGDRLSGFRRCRERVHKDQSSAK